MYFKDELYSHFLKLFYAGQIDLQVKMNLKNISLQLLKESKIHSCSISDSCMFQSTWKI